jgi:polysaccharide export outer membrane protein
MKMRIIHYFGSGIKWMLILSLLLSSCVSQKKVQLLQEKTAKELSTQFENSKSITYRVQVGDHLYIKVYSVDPKTSKFFQTDFPNLMNPTYLYLNSFVVDEFGFINFSFVDKMYVKGLTVVEVKDLIQKTLNEYFKECTVTVKLVNFQVAVLGDVNSPGNFTITQEQINLFQALGLAGGLKEFGNRKEVKIVRQTATGSEMYLVDLTDNKILQSPYFYLMPNDIVYVEPMNNKPFVFEKMPYSLFFGMLSVLVAGASLALTLTE